MTMKKKILFVYPEMMVGGSTTSLLALLKSLDPARFEVDLILYRKRGELLGDIPASIRLLPPAGRYPENSFAARLKKSLLLLATGYLPRALFNEWKYHRRLGLNLQVMADGQAFLSRKLDRPYDVAIGFLELWSHAYLVSGVQAARRIGWVHVDYEKAGYVPRLDQERFRRLDQIACVSGSCRETLGRAFPAFRDKMVVMENILSADWIRERSRASGGVSFDGLKIITVCRLTIHTKGLDRIVRTAGKLKAEGFRFRWFIAGDGEDRAALERLIAEHDLKDTVLLLGLQLNPYPILKTCDVFVLPSRNEGKPMAVTEAQILGLPVIVTDYLSAREQVSHGMDGLIAGAPEEASIHRALREILEHPERLEIMKRNVQRKSFDHTQTIQSFYQFIE